MVIPLRRRRSSRALAAVVWLLAAGEAWGDGLSATIQVDYSNSQQTLTDATGRTATLYSSVVPQRYLLSLDKQLWPFLTANAFAQYEWTPGRSVVNGVESEISNHRWNVFASLIAGPPVLNFTPYYSRRQEYAVFNSAGVGGTSPTLVNQSFGVYAGWNPAGLPLVSLQVGRREVSDLHGEIQDTRTDDILFSLTYVEVQNLLLRYTLRWSQFWDQRTGVETNDLFQGAQVTWSASALEGRFQSALSYTVGYRNTERLSSGSGTVSVQQFPIAGLSLVETFPSLPALNTLLPNPALIDGNTVTSAGIDIGYGPALAGDQNYRDLGVQFANTTTPVNVLWLWVDRQLPPGVAASYTFTAWQSDDNLNWTQLPLAGAVAFGVFDNRFEIPIVRTQARFLKVLTKPLAPGVTTDPKYADVFVTELQAYLVVPASQLPARSWDANGNFNGSARLLLWRDWNLTYWLSVAASHQKDFLPNDWSVTNAVSVSKQVAPSVSVSARVDRTDSEVANRPHEATNRWSAQVSYDPIPVLGAAFSYSGALNDYALGTYLSNGFTLSGHADPWRGVSLNATAGYTWARDELGRTLSGANANVGITLVPIPVLTINGNWGVNTSLSGGTAIALRGDQTTILQGNLAFTPIPALIFTAGLTRSTGTGQGPQTLVNFGAGFSPFAGGQLQIRFSYDETLDTQAQMRSRRFGPGLRWNIRPGAHLDASYTWFDSLQPFLITQNRSFFASLFVSIR
jgi:hypothetical protein